MYSKLHDNDFKVGCGLFFYRLLLILVREFTSFHSQSPTPIEMKNSTWVRVLNFGREAHLVSDDKTMCGRNITNFATIVQNHPPKRCKQCLRLSKLVYLEPILIPTIS